MSHLTRHMLIALIAVAAFATPSSSLRASCGDYLLHERNSIDPLSHGDFGFELSARHDGEPSKPMPFSPCRNGGCRRAPQVPPAPSAPVPLTFFKTPLGLTSADSDLTGHQCLTHLISHDSVAPDQFLVGEIEHPPRPRQ